MYSHLVTIKVGVEGGTCQRMELDSLTLYQLGLEGLDTETVQCRSTVQQHRMTLHHILQDIPDNGFTAVNYLLGALHRLDNAALDEFADNERFVELCSHQLGQTALAHLQLGTHDDNRTGRIVDTLTEQVLAETSCLTLERIRKRLQRTVAVTLHGTALS